MFGLKLARFDFTKFPQNLFLRFSVAFVCNGKEFGPLKVTFGCEETDEKAKWQFHSLYAT